MAHSKKRTTNLDRYPYKEELPLEVGGLYQFTASKTYEKVACYDSNDNEVFILENGDIFAIVSFIEQSKYSNTIIAQIICRGFVGEVDIIWNNDYELPINLFKKIG